MLWPADLDPSGPGAASHQAAADGLVLGHASDVDAFQWNVGAAVAGSTWPYLSDRLAADTEAAAIDGRSGPRPPSKGWLKLIKRKSPFAPATAFFDPGNAGKILIAGAVEVIDRDTNEAKPQRMSRLPSSLSQFEEAGWSLRRWQAARGSFLRQSGG